MANIRAIFSGKTKTYTVDGVAFDTAICKQEIHGSVKIGPAGVEGNEVANHKNAIYAYCAENYSHWNQSLALTVPWQYGMVGENLTLEGIDESQVYIGDIFKIGAVELQVSGCRAPCENFLWRVNLPRSFLKTYQESGRTGFYLEVLATGVIQAGDTLQHLPCEHDSISVGDLARFLMQPQADADELDRLISLPGMGQQMQSALVAARNLQIEKTLVKRNRWSGWKPFIVSEIVQESQNIKSFYLSPTDGTCGVAGYRAGQFLTVRLTMEHGEKLSRCWSISSYDESLQGYRISVQREAEGRASRYMHDRLKIGDQLELMAPNGHFTLNRGAVAVPVVLISAGIGITPMLSMLQAHVARQDKRLPSLVFIHSTHNSTSHAFRTEVDQIVAQHPQLQRHYIHTRPSAGSVAGLDFDTQRRLDSAALQSILSALGCWFAEKWLSLGPADCEYYVCGPAQFQHDVITMLQDLNVASHAIFHESFGAGLGAQAAWQLGDAKVSFSRSGHSAVWQQDADMSLLELAEANGLSPDFSCRNGQCGLCRSTLLQGDVVYPRAPSLELAPRDVLLCCALPKGDVVLDI